MLMDTYVIEGVPDVLVILLDALEEPLVFGSLAVVFYQVLVFGRPGGKIAWAATWPFVLVLTLTRLLRGPEFALILPADWVDNYDHQLNFYLTLFSAPLVTWLGLSALEAALRKTLGMLLSRIIQRLRPQTPPIDGGA